VRENLSCMKGRAQELRKNSTDAENHLWYFLRDRRLNGYKFKRQYVVEPYIIDFICQKKKLIIELDGGQHVEAHNYDENRTVFLKMKGYKVLRFWNDEVFKETESILTEILNALTPPLSRENWTPK
jgi:very-short-patch-repair endonuclease